MTSGQCTMGANTKVRVWLPRDKLSPSFTTTRRSLATASGPKNCSIYTKVLALPTTFMSGYLAARRAMLAPWSGSMWETTRYSGMRSPSASVRFASQASVARLSTVSRMAVFSSRMT